MSDTEDWDECGTEVGCGSYDCSVCGHLYSSQANTSRLVEEVARDMAWKRESFWIGHDDDDRIAIVDREWPKYAADAQAAILATLRGIREPDGVTVAAIDDHCLTWECFMEDGAALDVNAVFTAMIDHLIKSMDTR